MNANLIWGVGLKLKQTKNQIRFKRMIILSVAWVVLASLLVLNSIYDLYWFWFANFGGFAFLILSIIMVQFLAFKKMNLGLALTLSYFLLALFITIAVYNYHGEQSEWYWICVFTLGLPSSLLQGSVKEIFQTLFNSSSSAVPDGLSFMILGSLQYFFIGWFLQRLIAKEKQ